MRMKNIKKYLTLRFKDANKNDSKRMNITEWDEFKNIADYFKSSDDFLIEASINYNLRQNSNQKSYTFSETTFDKECTNVPGLKNLKDILKSGKTRRKIVIKNNSYKVEFSGTDVLVSYYPPYVISFDTTYQTRINIDLSLTPSIEVDSKKIVISFSDSYE